MEKKSVVNKNNVSKKNVKNKKSKVNKISNVKIKELLNNKRILIFAIILLVIIIAILCIVFKPKKQDNKVNNLEFQDEKEVEGKSEEIVVELDNEVKAENDTNEEVNIITERDDEVERVLIEKEVNISAPEQ